MFIYSKIIFIFTLLFFTACSKSQESAAPTATSAKIHILSTTAMIDDLVAQLGQERIAHTVLIKGEIDPHSYELVKGDDEKMDAAHIIFYNGLGLEHGASVCNKILHHKNACAIGDKIYQKHPQKILIRDGQADPHIWMDISLWQEAVSIIVQELSILDPDGASFYIENGELLKREMGFIHEEIQESLGKVPADKRFLVSSHDAFNYFARKYLSNSETDWHLRCQAPEGLSPDGQLSSWDIQRIVDHLSAYQITVVFSESNMPKESLKKIISVCAEKELAVKISTKPLYADTLGPPGSGAETYLKMMKYNAEVLLHEWTP